MLLADDVDMRTKQSLIYTRHAQVHKNFLYKIRTKPRMLKKYRLFTLEMFSLWLRISIQHSMFLSNIPLSMYHIAISQYIHLLLTFIAS